MNMVSWWVKSSSRDEKKNVKKERFIDAFYKKIKNASELKGYCIYKGSQRSNHNLSEKVFSISRSAFNSAQVSRCESFTDESHEQPLPVPGIHRFTKSGISSSQTSESGGFFKPFPFSSLPQNIPCQSNPSNTIGALATTSGSSDSLLSSDDALDSQPLSPQASEYGSGKRTAISSPSRTRQKDQSSLDTGKNQPKPLGQFLRDPMPSTSSRRGHFKAHLRSIQIPKSVGFCSTPTSMKTSPCRSPVKGQGHNQVVNLRPYIDLNSLSPGNYSSPGSGQTSGHNSVDIFSPMFSPGMMSPGPNSRVCSPISSPRMMSPGPSPRVQSGTVTPLNPRGREVAVDLQVSQSDDGRYLQSHRLPVPPITVSSSSPFSTSSSAARSPRTLGQLESSTGPVQKWKKGRLVGRGTFGHVYLGFSSETGEMCAMKEVTLFADDAKSKECTEQLEQEIALLSQLSHPNIVQYYGSETINDKLYIYLEFVSGGSIHKLLQEYGPLGEAAVRSYARQILSGLSYLHAKNTLHRDIKGANILVEPNGLVKLADFGMAKHVNGQSCTLSFKGSPYWMAPEVIRNSKGCNLAVDIWSLGCTVIEMATAKPPWSQYGGIPALFKIGNSKELPSIPDHLSEEGKDFVRQCLQRNPQYRPTALKLLEHPFVKNAAALEGPSPVPKAVRSKDVGHVRKLSCLALDGITNHPRRDSGSRDAYNMPKNISCPVSPVGSPLPDRKPFQHLPRKISTSPLLTTPHTTSGSSTHHNISVGGGGAIPSHLHLHQPLHEGTQHLLRSQQKLLYNGGTHDSQIFRGIARVSHVCHLNQLVDSQRSHHPDGSRNS